MTPRTHTDRCPGVFRPWIAKDGAIVRIRLVGGVLPVVSLRRLMEIADEHADGTVLLTKRTNLQLRGIAHDDGRISPALVGALTEAGFLPSPTHELVRNIMVSPMTGRIGGNADLRATAAELDRLLCADPDLASLAGRFLFVLDDGRGDVAHRTLDLGVTAVDSAHAQLRVGSRHWGPIVTLDEGPTELIGYAKRFLAEAGTGDTVPWHIDELPESGAELLGEPHHRDPRTQATSPALPYGIIAQDHGGAVEHFSVPDGLLNRSIADTIADRASSEIIVTPWRSVLLPDLETP